MKFIAKILLFIACTVGVQHFSAQAIEFKINGASSIREKFLRSGSTLSSEDGLANIRPIHLSGSIASIGRFRGVFTNAQVFSDTLVTFRGVVTTKSGKQTWAASFFKNINTLSIFFTDNTRAQKGQRHFGIEIRVPILPEADENIPAEAIRSPLSKIVGGCAEKDSIIHEDPATPDELDTSEDEAAKKIKTHILAKPAASKRSPLHIIQLGVALDPSSLSAINAQGIKPEDYVNSVVNAANTILTPAMKYRIKVTKVLPFTTDPFNSSESEELLRSFAQYQVRNTPLGDVDLYHLFTNRNLESNTIGIAFTGGLCNNAFLRFSLTQLIPMSLQHLVFVHEIGHNLGSHHDKQGNTIMAPGLNFSNPAKKFSKRSIKEMRGYLSKNHESCTLSAAENKLPAIIGDRTLSSPSPVQYKVSFYLSTNSGQSIRSYPLSIEGRRIVRGAQFEKIYSSQAAVYGLNFTSQPLVQYTASIHDGRKRSSSAILTIPHPGVTLSLREQEGVLHGTLNGISGVFPAKIEIVDRSNKKSNRVLGIVQTAQDGTFSLRKPHGVSQVIARWYYLGSKETVVSKKVG